MLSRLREELSGSRDLNAAMQDFLREWSACSARRNRPVLLDQAKLGWFAELNRGLRDELDDGAFVARMRLTTGQLRALAREIVAVTTAQHPLLDGSRIRALLDDAGPGSPAGMLFDSAA